MSLLSAIHKAFDDDFLSYGASRARGQALVGIVERMEGQIREFGFQRDWTNNQMRRLRRASRQMREFVNEVKRMMRDGEDIPYTGPEVMRPAKNLSELHDLIFELGEYLSPGELSNQLVEIFESVDRAILFK